MKSIFIIIGISLLFSCANTNSFNRNLANKNMSKVNEIDYYPYENNSEPVAVTTVDGYVDYYIPSGSEFFPVISHLNSKLLKVNDKVISHELISHNIIGGEHKFLVSCYIRIFKWSRLPSYDIKNITKTLVL